jgi:toluene monooxygenase system ferredoxin subunit
MTAFRCAAAADSLWSGEMLGTVVNGRPVLLVNVDGQVCAFEDRCRHLGVPLSQGRLQGRVLTCHAHEWQYDAVTGHGINPAHVRLQTFPVRMEKDSICVDSTDPETP